MYQSGNFRGDCFIARLLNRRLLRAALLAGLPWMLATPAVAACDPAAASNVVATCTGTTINQGAGAPGTSAGSNGYGGGGLAESNVDVTVVQGALVRGSFHGITLGSATVRNAGTIVGVGPVGFGGVFTGSSLALTNTGLIIGTFGAGSNGGSVTGSNTGSIVGTSAFFSSVSAATTLTFVNSGSITGAGGGLSGAGAVSVTNTGTIAVVDAGGVQGTTTVSVNNSGTITSTNRDGIASGVSATVINSGSITSGALGVRSNFADVVNSGTIISGSTGIQGVAGVNLTNTGSIVSQGSAVNHGGTSNVVNSGLISSSTVGIGANAALNTVNLVNTGTVAGGTFGVRANVVGNITNSGTITGNGGTAILFGTGASTLTIAPTSVINGLVTGGTNNTFQLGGTGTGTFDISAIGAVAQYRNFTTFNVVGPAAWTLTGTSTFTGPINVNAGTLAVNGNSATSSLTTVNAGGTLGGTGTLGNTTISGGTLAPGNSVGTITVQGNLAFATAATYLVEVTPTGADRTNVTGTATLGGATVSAVYSSGGFITSRYTILSATGGVNGTFGALVNTSLPSNITSSLSYDTNNVYLNLALNFAGLAGINSNQTNIANALVNSFNTAGGIPLAFASLSAQGLTAVSGEHATGAQQTTFDAMDKFVNVLTDPFMGTRAGGAPATGAAGYADESLAYAAKRKQTAERDAYAAFKAPLKAAPLFERRWSVWGAGYGGTQQTDGDAGTGSQKFTNHVYGGAAGFDYRLTPETLVGFALGGAGTTFGLANGLGDGRSEMFQAGLYGRHTSGPAYVSGAVAWGWQDITTNRTVFANSYRANFDANAITGRLEGGWRFAYGASGITPYAAGQVTSFFLPGYAETLVAGVNTFALTYAEKDVTASRTELGLRGDTSFTAVDAVVTLRGRAAWAHNFNTDRNISALFQTIPAAGFTVFGASPAQNSALVSAGAEAKWLNGISVAATFEGEFSSRTDSYAGKAVVRYQW